MSRLLLEIGTEAIPAGYIPPALRALEEKATKSLEDKRLPGTTVSTRGTAKRLVLEIENLPEKQEDVVREVQGPRVDVAFKDGKPTRAAEGFARKLMARLKEAECRPPAFAVATERIEEGSDAGTSNEGHHDVDLMGCADLGLDLVPDSGFAGCVREEGRVQERDQWAL